MISELYSFDLDNLKIQAQAWQRKEKRQDIVDFVEVKL